MKELKDTRIVYSANCTWWDSIDKVSKKPGSNLPCCPHCGSVLFESPTIEDWWEDIDGWEKRNHPGYRGFMEWLRGKCYYDKYTPSPVKAWEKARKDYDGQERRSKDDPVD